MQFKHSVVVGAILIALMAAGRSCQRATDAAVGEPVVLTQQNAPLPAATDTSLAGFTGSLDLAVGQSWSAAAPVPAFRIEPTMPAEAASMIAAEEPSAPGVGDHGDLP